eukprot:TRINITY_DN4772_c0_g1_i1.p1 TRINITY_DN4772_c0_g1~~TRINITY_DN4772_c0_g1_i1.p1  ORF type:complete len:513 (+),score=116.78 TRINITY_DN4772_c0_g1_i1:207-1745(+)
MRDGVAPVLVFVLCAISSYVTFGFYRLSFEPVFRYSYTALIATLLISLPMVCTSKKWRGAMVLMLSATVTLWIVMAVSIAFHTRIFPNHDLHTIRVGAVGSDYARIMFRYPSSAQKLNCLYRMQSESTWHSVPNVMARPALDHTGVATLERLEANRHYEVVVFSTTAVAAAPVLSATFQTFPNSSSDSEGGVQLTFAFGSCTYPKFKPLVGFTQIQDSGARFLINLGDLIYSDHPVWLGGAAERYYEKYRRVYADPAYSVFSRQVPSFAMYDDHEIYNNFDPSMFTENDPTVLNAIGAWQAYAGGSNPTPLRANVKYYSFGYGDVAFFVMDLRSYRSSPSMEASLDKTMLGMQQRDDLMRWLKDEKAAIKILASSVPMTMNIWDDREDSWRGYEHERALLLEAMRGQPIVLLSADQHMGGLYKLQEGLYELAASPLDAFTVWNNAAKIAWIRAQQDTIYMVENDRMHGIIEVDTQSQPVRLVFRHMCDGVMAHATTFAVTSEHGMQMVEAAI